MAVTASDILTYVGADDTQTSEATRCLSVASAVITQVVGDRTVPAAVLDEVTLEVSASVFRRRDNPASGSAGSYVRLEGATPVREPSDPMRVAYGLLGHYLTRGIG